MAIPVVEVRRLSVGYGDVVVLEDIDLTVDAGEIVALTGVNGVGKSTLLSCLAGFRRPAAGTASVLGGPPRDNAEFWRAVAIVADQPTWYPGLTVRELLELVRMTHQPSPGWCLPANELVEIFGLSARADASPLSLSSGQRQRLSLAAALARPSRLLLLDEPEQSLDAGFREELAALLREQYTANGGTVVMATHDHEFAVTAGARTVPLADGRVVDPGAPDSEYDEDLADEPGQYLAEQPRQAGRDR
ncbi:MAG TPA: ABC transporter ATP-binding protein [Trebonia sp.]|nr:ABC transporter ATP-binding protein [Trebonia sp.]